MHGWGIRLWGNDVYEIHPDWGSVDTKPNPYAEGVALKNDWLRAWNGAK